MTFGENRKKGERTLRSFGGRKKRASLSNFNLCLKTEVRGKNYSYMGVKYIKYSEGSSPSIRFLSYFTPLLMFDMFEEVYVKPISYVTINHDFAY